MKFEYFSICGETAKQKKVFEYHVLPEKEILLFLIYFNEKFT